MRALVLWCALLLGAGLMHRPAAAQVVSLVGGTAFAGSSEHDGTRQGRLFGARMTLDLSERVGLRFGPDYTERNLPALRAGSPAPNQVQTLAYETSYLEVPILLKLSPFPTASVSPHVLVGPALGVRLDCQVQAQLLSLNAFGQTTGITTSETDCADELVGSSAKSFQIDARVGVGVDINVLDPMIGSIEVVYGAGVYKIFEAFAAKGRATFVRVGIGIPLG